MTNSPSDKRIYCAFLIFGMIIFLLWLSTPWLVYCAQIYFSRIALERMGTLGDTFGVLNALFSAAAFALLALGLMLESAERRADTKRNNEQFDLARKQFVYSQLPVLSFDVARSNCCLRIANAGEESPVKKCLQFPVMIKNLTDAVAVTVQPAFAVNTSMPVQSYVEVIPSFFKPQENRHTRLAIEFSESSINTGSILSADFLLRYKNTHGGSIYTLYRLRFEILSAIGAPSADAQYYGVRVWDDNREVGVDEDHMRLSSDLMQICELAEKQGCKIVESVDFPSFQMPFHV